MILTGSKITSVKHARLFARHLFKEENIEIIVHESPLGSNSRAEIEDDLVDFQLQTDLTQGSFGIFHVAVSPNPNDAMSPEQWNRSVELIEEEFALSGQPRIMIFHRKKDERKHLHVLWQTVKDERIIDIWRYKKRLQRQADQMEIEFGHKRTRRKANEHTLTITHTERMRKARTGQNPLLRKRIISEIWQESKTPEAFLQTMRVKGFVIAKGDRSRYPVVDNRGEVYNLTRQLPKVVRQKEVHLRLENHFSALPYAKEIQERRRILRLEKQKSVQKRMKRIKKRDNEKELER
ncbi:MAG: hypothetical protein R3B93_14175 [Bacteroidia bacterium]